MDEKEVIMDVKVKKGRSRRKRKDVANDTHVTKDTNVSHVNHVSHVSHVAKDKALKVEPKVAKVEVTLVSKKPMAKKFKHKMTRKAFRPKRISMVIDNTRKTQRRRESILETIDNLSDAQARIKAVAANLIRPEKIATIPIALVKTLLKGIRELKMD
jgi:predicted membrane chloride channel (bestrophin family)